MRESREAQKEIGVKDRDKDKPPLSDKLESSLARERDILKGIMENTGTMMAYFDLEFNFIAVNSAYAKGSGHTAEELIGKNHFALFPNPENQAIFELVKNTGEPVLYYDKPFEFADQPERGVTYWDWTLAPVKDETGHVQGLVLSLFETTQRKRAEEEVRALSRFPAENPNPVMRISKDGTIQYCNEAGLPILNEWKCKVEQLAPSRWCQIVADVFKSGTKGEFEEAYGTQTFSFTLAPIAEAGYVNIYGRDRTERKKAEEALREAKEELETRVSKRTAELVKINEELEAQIAERKKAQAEAQSRADQQAVIAQLGQGALGGCDLSELFHEAMKRVAQTLNVEYCKVLELLPGEKELLLRAGVGWKEGLVGRATVGTGTDSQAGYTLLSDEPVIVEDLRTEKRFSGPPLLHEHKVVSGMSVIISGQDKPFGVLGAHTTRRRTFTKDDINFLQAVANVLATTIEHKKAEELLRKSEQKYRNFVDNAIIGVYQSSFEGEIRYVNESLARLLEFESCEEFIAEGALRRWKNPEDRKHLIEQLKKAGRVTDFETEFLSKTGKTIKAIINAVVEGDVFSGMIIDITERKQTEEAVKAERKRFINILEMLPAYLVLLTPDYHVSYANHFFRERFGEDRGRRCFEYLFGRTEPCPTCETYKVLKTMSPLEWEWTGPDGRNYYIFDAPFTDSDGSNLIMEVGIDITELKRAEEALRKARDELEMRVQDRTKELREASEKMQVEIDERKQTEEDLRQTRDYLESLFDYANAPIISWGSKFEITRFNHAFEQLTGYKAEEVIGKYLSLLFPEESKEESLTKIQRTLTEYWEVVEIPILRKDGKVRIVLWNSANIYAPDGKTLVATIAQGQDITESKQMQTKLEEYARHLETLVEERTRELRTSERFAAIGQTAGMVGHDIRNPLQTIEGALYLAKEEVKALPLESEEKESLRETLETINEQAKYINKIVSDLQDFARPLSPQIEETNINRLINDALSTIEIPKNIEVSVLINEDVPKLIVDPMYMKRVLVNLITNAVQAMPNGGKLAVKATRKEDAAYICVEDTGLGIPEDVKPKIFQPLFTTKAKGQGFGLAVCKRMVEAHNGEIAFQSEVGKGSTFTVRIPISKEAS